MSTAADSITVSRLDGGSAKAHHAKALRVWLGLVALLIVAMILVGGATRLTDFRPLHHRMEAGRPG